MKDLGCRLTEMLGFPETSHTVPLGYYLLKVARELQVLILIIHSSYYYSAAWSLGKLYRW